MRVNVTISCELGRRYTPRRRVRVTSIDIRRDFGVREEPDIDAVAGPLGGIDSAVGLVESIAVRLAVVGVDSTTSIKFLARSLDITVIRGESATEARFFD